MIINKIKFDKLKKLDYKDIYFLKTFITSTYKIIPNDITGIPAKYQRKVACFIKRSRFLALIPYCNRHFN